MKISTSQWKTLQAIAVNHPDGACTDGQGKVVTDGGNVGAAVSVVKLVLAGLVHGKNGRLHLTEYGWRHFPAADR